MEKEDVKILAKEKYAVLPDNSFLHTG